MLAGEIIERVRVILRDETSAARWPDAELLTWLRDGVDAIGNAKPEETGDYLTVEMENSNRQELPAHVRQLVRLERNAEGKRINKADRYALTVCEYLYGALDDSREVLDYWQDSATSREYWVYPLPRKGVKVQGYFSVYQPAITGLGDTLKITSAYRNALVDYVLSSAFSKDAEYADNARLSAMYAESFANQTGIRIQGKEAEKPTTHYDRRKAE